MKYLNEIQVNTIASALFIAIDWVSTDKYI